MSVKGGVGAQSTHDSGALHVSGEALYVDDLPEPEKLLHGSIVMSPVAHGKILSIDPLDALNLEGVVDFCTAANIPGHNEIGPIFKGEPLLAEEIMEYIGQPVAVVAASTHELSRRAVDLVKINFEELDPVLSIEEALARESYVAVPHTLQNGDALSALNKSPKRLKGELSIGGQDHFYLEGQIAMAVPTEAGDIKVYSSTQHPTEVQCLVAEALGIPFHSVSVEIRRMGGGFGGKETQPAIMACCAALIAKRTSRPVKLRLNRDDDMIMTGKRHPFLAKYEVGFDEAGKIHALDMTLACSAGNVADLSSSILDRALFHSDNTYFLEHCRIRGFACKTNLVSNTAFRGFGGPQGMIAIENIMEEIARECSLDPLEVRRINLYGKEERNITPYHQKVEDNISAEVIDELVESSNYLKRRKEIEEFNRSQKIVKRGLALSPVKFGISFTTSFLNQAGALIHIYKDGSITLNHGGTEMGQGLFIKVAQVVAEEFQVDVGRIK
ncbi:molybdopterin-dependent oxidoreductase, partial [bacterium]|nr:molybdopterin-dependent oxidoreductase [bacterium]